MQETSRPFAHPELIWRFAGVAIASISLSALPALLIDDDAAGIRAGVTVLALIVIIFPQLPRHDRRRLGPANLVTFGRAVLVGWVAAAMGGWLAPLLASAALAMDGVDGWVARRTGWSSDFGAALDMELDALLTLLLSVLVWLNGAAGAWVLLSGAMRYLFVAAGWALPWLNAPLPPRYRRKVVCVFQIGSLLICLVPILSPPITTTIAAVGLAALVYSFGVDVWWLFRHRSQTA